MACRRLLKSAATFQQLIYNAGWTRACSQCCEMHEFAAHAPVHASLSQGTHGARRVAKAGLFDWRSQRCINTRGTKGDQHRPQASRLCGRNACQGDCCGVRCAWQSRYQELMYSTVVILRVFMSALSSFARRFLFTVRSSAIAL